MDTDQQALATDVGGTFVDCVCRADDGTITVEKRRTSGRDPSSPIRDFLRKEHPDLHLHGTTIATNAILEEDGGEVVFVTTAGFGDILKIGRQDRPSLYDFRRVPRKPPVKPEHVLEVNERVLPNGEVVQPLKKNELERIRSEIRRLEPDAVAVCLLHSYRHPEHERKMKDALSEIPYPVSISSEVLSEFREYERATTTVLNSYLRPMAGTYLEEVPPGSEHPLYLMTSSGGLQDASTMVERPVEMTLSGPAGGVIASSKLGDRLGENHLINLDMGGTSADVSLVQDGKPVWTRKATIDDLPIGLPVLDIETIGAGGGSIVSLDEAGALRVGPESAGSDPGPVCYDSGGTELTATDAHVMLGHIGKNTALAEKLSLNISRTRSHFASFSEDTEMGPLRTARGILEVLNSKMSRAIRNILVRQGADPDESALVVFGGAGPLHACSLAERIGALTVYIPVEAGVFSARGLLQSDIVCHRSKTIMKIYPGSGAEDVRTVVEQLRSEVIDTMLDQGTSRSEIAVSPSLDLRYRGQSYQINVPHTGEDTIDRFRELHEARFGFAPEGEPVEVVNARVEGRAPGLELLPDSPAANEGSPVEERGPLFPESDRTFPVYKRSELGAGQVVDGPAIIEEMSSTIRIVDGWSAQVLEEGTIRITGRE